MRCSDSAVHKQCHDSLPPLGGTVDGGFQKCECTMPVTKVAETLKANGCHALQCLHAREFVES